MSDILTGTSVIAAFLGGAVALFAPCCISVMLPAYFATSFQRRSRLLTMTVVFGTGSASVILPIAFGAATITRFILGRHTLVYLAGTALMFVLGGLTLAGRSLPLPRPGMRARRERGAGAVFALGAFSGIASACCAPVLAGVAALSGAASSFLAALLGGVAYVFGMVLPLFLIALLWDRYDWGNSAWLRGRDVTIRVGRRTVTVHSSSLASGLIMIAMGVVVAGLAITGPSMATSGWQARLTADLQHDASVVLDWLDSAPGWLSALGVFAVFAWVMRRAVRQQVDASIAEDTSDDHHDEPTSPSPFGRRADARRTVSRCHERLARGPRRRVARRWTVGIRSTARGHRHRCDHRALIARRFIRACDRRWLAGPLVVRGGVDVTLAAAASPYIAGVALGAYGASTSIGMVA